MSSGGQEGFYHFKGHSRKLNDTVVVIYLCCCCCTSIPFKWFYSRTRIHIGGNSNCNSYSRSCCNINECSAASWEDAELLVWYRVALLSSLQVKSHRNGISTVTWRSVLPLFCDFSINIAKSCSEALTLFLLMKIISL